MSSIDVHHAVVHQYSPCNKIKNIPVRLWIVLMIFCTSFIISSLASSGVVLMEELLQKPKRIKVPFCLRKSLNNNSEWIAVIENNDLKEQFKWSEAIQWQILVSYFYGIIISSLLAGVLVEFLGPKHTTLYPLLFAGLFNIAGTYCIQWHWGALFASRFIIGLAAGIVYPAVQSLIGHWSPTNEKGRFLTAFMGYSLGTAFVWFLVQYTSTSIKWWWSFYILAVLVLIYSVAFHFLVYSNIEQHKFIKNEEKTFIKLSQGDNVSLKKTMPPFKAILSSSPVQALNILYFGYMWGVHIHLQITPMFMEEFIGLSQQESVFLATLPHIAHFIGAAIFGNLSDIVIKRQLIDSTLFSKCCVIFSHILPSFIMMSFGVVKCSGIIASILLILSNFLSGAVACNLMRNPSDLSPNFTATIFAMNMFCGEITGFFVPRMALIILPYGTGILPWIILFLISGLMYFGTGIIYLCFGSAEIQEWNAKD